MPRRPRDAGASCRIRGLACIGVVRGGRSAEWGLSRGRRKECGVGSKLEATGIAQRRTSFSECG